MDRGKDGCYLSLPQQMKVKTLLCKESTFLSAHSSKAETCDGHVVHMACLTCTSVGHTGIIHIFKQHMLHSPNDAFLRRIIAYFSERMSVHIRNIHHTE